VVVLSDSHSLLPKVQVVETQHALNLLVLLGLLPIFAYNLLLFSDYYAHATLQLNVGSFLLLTQKQPPTLTHLVHSLALAFYTPNDETLKRPPSGRYNSH